VAAEVAAGEGVAAEGERSEEHAEEDDVEGRGARLDDEDAEGAGEHHRRRQLGRALVL
jgi:hypothetical protein